MGNYKLPNVSTVMWSIPVYRNTEQEGLLNIPPPHFLGGFFTESTPTPAAVVRATDRQELTSSWSRATIEALGPTDGKRMLEPS